MSVVTYVCAAAAGLMIGTSGRALWFVWQRHLLVQQLARQCDELAGLLLEAGREKKSASEEEGTC